VIPLGKNEKDGGLKLTVARYYLPSGRTIQNKGVTPDIIVYPGEVPRENNDSISIKEKDLKKHLEDELKKLDSENNVSTEGNTTIPDMGDESNSTAKKKKKGAILDKKKIFSDMQLKSAIDILKVLILENETKRKK
jgi:carboxyl-terminal processing protease